MSDIDSIFEPTQPPLPANGPLPAAPKKRGRKKRAVAAVPASASPEKPKRGRRRQANAAPQTPPGTVASLKRRGRPRRTAGAGPHRMTPGGMKLDWTTAVGVLVGLKSIEAELVGKISTALQATNKKSRQRVLEAVGRIFA